MSLGILGASYFGGIDHAPKHAPKKLGCQYPSWYALKRKSRVLIVSNAAFGTSWNCLELLSGGGGEIRTHDTGLSPYASLAGKCLRPLGHASTLSRPNQPVAIETEIIAGSLDLVNYKCCLDEIICSVPTQVRRLYAERGRPIPYTSRLLIQKF